GLVVEVEVAAVGHDGVLGGDEGAGAVGVAPEEEMDLVGDEGERRMQAAQAPILTVPGDAARKDRHAEAGEREALDELEISAEEEASGERVHGRQPIGDLLALENSPRE